MTLVIGPCLAPDFSLCFFRLLTQLVTSAFQNVAPFRKNGTNKKIIKLDKIIAGPTSHPLLFVEGLIREFFRDPQQWDPLYGKRDPYHSHIFRDSYGSGMGIVWVPLTIVGGPIVEGPWNHPWVEVVCETGWFHSLLVTPGSSSGTGFDGFDPSTLGPSTADLSDLVSNIFGIFTPKIGEDEPILTSIFFKGIETIN